MGRRFGSTPREVAIAVLISLLLVASLGAAAQETVLYSFSPGNRGLSSGLTFDAFGNLFGTTSGGGGYGSGAAFELSPTSGGGWTEALLHTFKFNGRDGVGPMSGLIIDTAGNLYGTTEGGGNHDSGTVFELTPTTGGVWTESILHDFSHNVTDGTFPNCGLISDTAGNLYGTASLAGAFGNGAVFELVSSGGGWVESVLYNFARHRDGRSPQASLVLDSVGNLFGTTEYGGSFGYGTIFELMPSNAGWIEQVLHNFAPRQGDGRNPTSSLVVDDAGNIYGTAFGGGLYGHGIVFKLSPQAGGNWKETVLHNFHENGADGQGPAAGLTFDTAGNIYGTTIRGGIYNGGTVFKMSPLTDGGWLETVLHSFGSATDGASPGAVLVLDSIGNLYGTTNDGGAYGHGTVFEIAGVASARVF